MEWHTGKCTSLCEELGAFLQRDLQDQWWVYQLDEQGAFKTEGVDDNGEPVWADPAHPKPFASLRQAQQWAEKNLR